MLIGASAQAQQHVINLPKSLDIRVSDGDTISFRSQGETIRVRLVGIGAPESKQAYGRESGSNLRSCINSGETIQVYYRKKDQYGRLLGKVVVDGRDCNLYFQIICVDANAEFQWDILTNDTIKSIINKCYNNTMDNLLTHCETQAMCQYS